MWRISITEKAKKVLEKLDKPIRNQIIRYFDKIILSSEDPTSFGKPLVANKKGLWRYRIGDYRLICSIQDDKLIILALSVGHRREIYS